MRSLIAVTLSALALLPLTTFAFPAPHPRAFGTRCSVAADVPDFPAGQTTLSVPSGQTAQFVGLGLGVQNYTCGSAGTFTSAGALATLFDISCLAKTSLFANIQTDAFDLLDDTGNFVKAEQFLQTILQSTNLVLGQHFFVTSPSGTGISPFFTFEQSLKNDEEFFLGAKTGDLKSPGGSGNVDWLQLTNVEGELAETVFRVDTVQGQPAASCTTGQTASIPYAAKYWFFSG